MVVDEQPLFFFGTMRLIDEIRVSDAILTPADFLKIK
jgi:hypothetical protein